MGCRTLKYFEAERSQGAFTKIFVEGQGERELYEKKGLNYSTFGATMPGRNYNSTASRYGFNGMEKDDELKGSGNSLDFGARIYDPRLGRFLSLDPLQSKNATFTPYGFGLSNPIMYVDSKGEWPGVTYTYFEMEASAGFYLNGARYIRQIGVARDEVGKTHFVLAYSDAFSHNDGDQVVFGGGGGIHAGVEQSFQAETFLGDQQGLENVMFDVSVAAGIGASFGFGLKRFSIAGDLGAEARVQATNTYIESSISLTDAEAKNVNDSRRDGNTYWGVTNATKEKDNNNRFWAEVTVGSSNVNTNQKVFSFDGASWFSEEYYNQAIKEEKEDDESVW